MNKNHEEVIRLLRVASENLDTVGASVVGSGPEMDRFNHFWIRLIQSKDGFEFRKILRDYVEQFPDTVPGINWTDSLEPHTSGYMGEPGTWFNVMQSNDKKGKWVAYNDHELLGYFPTRQEAIDACERRNRGEV